MFLLTLLVTLSAVLCTSASSVSSVSGPAPLPGRALVWSNARANAALAPRPRFVTRSLSAEELAQWVAGEGDAELVVLFTRTQTHTQTQEAFFSFSVTQSELVRQLLVAAPTVFSYVYSSSAAPTAASAAAEESFAQTLQRATHAEALLVLEPERIPAALTAETLSALLQNGKTDVVHIPLSSSSSATAAAAAAAQTLRALLSNEQDKKVVFAAVDESAAAVRPTLAGEFARVLDESAAETDPVYVYGEPLYKPEGAEYSIYYAGQYLYITPDIFTGLLTSLFVALALLTGLSCLGSIQGMSSFYDKLPVVGKEA